MASILMVCSIFFVIPDKIKANEEVVLIQAISTSGRTFVIRRGFADGIARKQESLFTTKNASFVAIAKIVNRHFSVWEIKENKGSVPFKKGELVIYSNSVQNIWTQISKHRLKTYLKTKKELVFKPKNRWILRGHYSYALSESISETDNDRYLGRVGFQVSAFFARRFSPSWEYAVGIRIDRENSTLENPALDVPSQRIMAAAEFTYHFGFHRSKSNFYIGGGLAYGQSSTTVDEATSTGRALVLPIAKIGYINKISPSYSLMLEGTFESIAATEAFIDSESQSTHILNSKFGIGIRF